METTTVASPSLEDKDHEIDSKAFRVLWRQYWATYDLLAIARHRYQGDLESLSSNDRKDVLCQVLDQLKRERL